MSSVSRRSFLRRSAAGWLGAATIPWWAGCQSDSPEGPNFVFLVADDLGFETLETYGGTSYSTPHLNSLAESGLQFERAFCNPEGTPSRVQLLTGRYPFRTGWTGRLNFAEGTYFNPEQETCFAQPLRKLGYATGISGKWQLAYFGERPDHPRECGFEESFCWTWKLNTDFGRLNDADPAYWTPSVWSNGKALEVPAGSYGPDLYCEWLLDFIRRHRARPFLAYYSMLLPGAPYLGPPYREGLVRADQASESPRNYPALVSYLDHLVGRILNELDSLGLRENTVLVFTSENGSPPEISSQWQGRTIRGGRGKLRDRSTRIPAILSWPGTVAAGETSSELLDHSDWCPTVLDLAGASHADMSLDGHSLAPRLLGEPYAPREWVFQQMGKQRCLRDARWKLYRSGTLIDLNIDPEETGQFDPKSRMEALAARQRLEPVLKGMR